MPNPIPELNKAIRAALAAERKEADRGYAHVQAGIDDYAFDPIGPGTPAWNSFDNACEAYQRAQTGPRPVSRNRFMKRYFNCRALMISSVARHGGDVEAWKTMLDSQKQAITER